jgi:prolyl 4-hydroxylase
MIQEFDDFLTSKESEEIINLATPAFEEQSVLGKNAPSDYRVADGTWLYGNTHQIIKDIKLKISKNINIPIEHMEDMNVVKYKKGGQYKVHHDFFHPNTDYFEESVGSSGQRIFTALIYLNDDFKGGETDFPKINKKIMPKKNKLVIWRNVEKDGSLIDNSLHAGLPVEEGIKYIGVIWIREKKFS